MLEVVGLPTEPNSPFVFIYVYITSGGGQPNLRFFKMSLVIHSIKAYTIDSGHGSFLI
jgi:hypothetical protein